MAGLRFSHILLIAALSAWMLALVINLFFPFLLDSFEAAPLLGGTRASIVEIPAHYLLSILPANRQDYFSMICFLLAIACAFIAGSVYGMESESERYAHYFEAENVVNIHEESHFFDLEKGELPPYSPHRAGESPYTDEKNTYPAAVGAGSVPGQMPSGDAMIGHVESIYYLSTSAFYSSQVDALARNAIIAANRADDAAINNTLVPTIYGRAQQPYILRPSLEGINSAFRAAANLHPGTTASSIKAPGMDPLFGARVTDDDLVYHGEPSKFVSASIEEVPEIELFSIYLGDEESHEGQVECTVEGNSLVHS